MVDNQQPIDPVREFLRKAGSKGGASRAKKHTAEQLAEWGRKGGRPKKQNTGEPAKEKKDGSL